MNRFWSLLLSIAFGADPALASCLPKYTALQTFERMSASVSQEKVFALSGLSDQGFYRTRVQLVARADGSGTIRFFARFDPAFDGVSLPYNLYALAVIVNGEILAWHDFTALCRSPGIGFFPGREVELPSLKLVGSGEQTLQIMVWGKL